MDTKEVINDTEKTHPSDDHEVKTGDEVDLVSGGNMTEQDLALKEIGSRKKKP